MGGPLSFSGTLNCCRKGCHNTCKDTKANRARFPRLCDLVFGNELAGELKEHVLNLSKGKNHRNDDVFIIIMQTDYFN